MPCMCGDLYCHSCGPAQGNHRCESCGEWQEEFESPGSKHDDARCTAEAQAVAQAEAEAWQWEQDHADEINKAIYDDRYEGGKA